jgi:large subunit ribosomal protein L28
MTTFEITPKGKMYGHNVSFSQRKTRKIFKPNIQKRKLTINGKKSTLKIATSTLRTLRKKGILK